MEKFPRAFQWGLLAILILGVRCEMEYEDPLLAHIPEVIDRLPPSKLSGEYYGGIPINFGNTITPLQLKNTPTSLRWREDKPGQFYVLMMLDLDGPTPENPTTSPVNHWMVGNIKGGKDNSWRSGTVLAEYFGPRLTEEMGIHRFVFLVYEQPSGGKIAFTETSQWT
ncbi:protein D3 [Folsomia candida]|uniref:OV-16 antigen n=1 Tax=Folsomia candida TaxID=158441 RepID=A0A226CTH8_FOLCA|nr:protein D3 [Folsomia candida]OXA36765.1 OV-16 antigen [Folsomia candida]